MRAIVSLSGSLAFIRRLGYSTAVSSRSISLSFHMFFSSNNTCVSRWFTLLVLILSRRFYANYLDAACIWKWRAIGSAQMPTAAISAMRSIAPTLVSSLFSIYLQQQLAGGNLVTYLLIGLNLMAIPPIRLSHFLPLRIISNLAQLEVSQQAA